MHTDKKQGSTQRPTMQGALNNCTRIYSKAQLTCSQWEMHSQIAPDKKPGSTHMLAMGDALTNDTLIQSKAQLTRSKWKVHSQIAHRHKARLNSHAHNCRCIQKLCTDTKQGSSHILAMGGAHTHCTQTQSKSQLTCSQSEVHS